MKQANSMFIAVLTVLGSLSSCGSTQKQRMSGLDWDDLTSDRAHYRNTTPVPRGGLTNNVSDKVSRSNSDGDVRHAPAQPTLEQLASGFQMEKPQFYEGGVYGKKGHVPVFAARLKEIPDYDRLYWVMVKVLSEKYGCFIKRKASTHAQVLVECRDRRRVVFHRNRGDGWIQFYGRQYDQQGREIEVRDHRSYVIEDAKQLQASSSM